MYMAFVAHPPCFRLHIALGGCVQGVGFRPFVYRLAHELGLNGFVRNTPAGVEIEVQGSTDSLDHFQHALLESHDCPGTPRLLGVVTVPTHASTLVSGFQILHSATEGGYTTDISPDLAACPDCLREMRDASDTRRHAYVLSNCTHCGPRYSVVRAVPYDRANTTLAPFVFCAECSAEYSDPADRRFHAQPTACRDCGPVMFLTDNTNQPILTADPIAAAAQMLTGGGIVAIKGIGGYHLACRADAGGVVQRLRDLKHRPAKPLAVMVPNIAAAERLVKLSSRGRHQLLSTAAPIVIATRRPHSNIADEVAPNSRRLGVLLAYTPLHHRLFDLIGNIPLVMTSANDDGSPMVFEEADADIKLAQLADARLGHTRPIARPVDDSVVLDGRHHLTMFRRARGFVPESLPLRICTAGGIAYGGEQKSTVAIVRHIEQRAQKRGGVSGSVILSQHLGDLSDYESFEQFLKTEQDLLQLFHTQPEFVACDLHPAYSSTRHARRRAEDLGLPLVQVQHHHAHAASVLAEHGETGLAVAIVLDGTGYGTDDAIWGGEILRCDLESFERVDHLSYFDLPGGDAAVRSPWRSGLALLKSAFGDGYAELAITRHLLAEVAEGAEASGFVMEMLRSRTGCRPTSSTGRLFDGVAALLGVAMENRFEAEAPAALEELADRSHGEAYAWTLPDTSSRKLDVGALVREIVNEIQAGVAPEDIAARFHATLARMLTQSAIRAADGCTRLVVLSGGAFCNDRLATAIETRLTRHKPGLKVLRNVRVPPNDGGLAYGQAAVACARLARSGCERSKPCA